MRVLVFASMGLLFGIVLSKAEVISWFRIQEMFLFQSFHMYGIIISAIITLATLFFVSKKLKLTTSTHIHFKYPIKQLGWKNYLFGGVIFGIGWAFTGACPGPLFVLFGQGLWVFALIIISATFGTFIYGLLRKNLPH